MLLCDRPDLLIASRILLFLFIRVQSICLSLISRISCLIANCNMQCVTPFYTFFIFAFISHERIPCKEIIEQSNNIQQFKSSIGGRNLHNCRYIYGNMTLIRLKPDIFALYTELWKLLNNQQKYRNAVVVSLSLIL